MTNIERLNMVYEKFQLEHPEFSKNKVPKINYGDDWYYNKYRRTARFQWLTNWSREWLKYVERYMK